MRRLLIIVAALVAIVAAGVTGLWFMNRSAAKDLIVAALDDAKAAGVDVAYEKLEIGGFPLAYEGQFQNITVQNKEGGVAATLSTAKAKVSLMERDTVLFTLPEEATISSIDAQGNAVGAPVKVTSQNATVAVTPGGPNQYDFAFASEKVRLQPAQDGAPDYLEFTAATASGKVDLDAKSARSSFKTDGVEARFQGAERSGQPQDAKLSMGPIASTQVSGPSEISIDTRYDSISFEMADTATLTATDVTVSAKGTPKPGETLPIEALFEQELTPETVARTFAAIAAGVASGGGFESKISFADMKFEVDSPEGAGSASGSENVKLRFESAGFVYGGVANPKVMSLSLKADTLVYDFQAPQAAGASGGPSSMSYDGSALEVELKADAADAFDLTPVLAAPNEDQAAQAFLLAVRDQIVAGGKVALSSQAAGGSSVMTLRDPQVPFTSIAGKSGPQSSELALTADSLSFASKIADVTYELAGGIAGEIGLKSVTLNGTAPLKKSDDPQQATVLFDMDTLTIGDSLWAMFDPGKKLDRSIRGLRIDLESDLIVHTDLLMIDKDPGLSGTPVTPGVVKIKQVFLGLFGMTAEATGEVTGLPFAPTTNTKVVLTDWRSFFENAMQTPFGVGQQTTLLIATNWLEQYGVEGDAANKTVLDIAFDGQSALINGKPFPEPQPVPAPAPAPGAPSAPSGEGTDGGAATGGAQPQ